MNDDDRVEQLVFNDQLERIGESEVFESHRKQSQHKRASNRERSTQLLQEKGVPFMRRNMGAHLIVSYEGIVVDFWPGTGKYIVRETYKRGRGVFSLLKVLGL